MAQVSRAPMKVIKISCPACNAKYEEPIDYCRKCGTKIIKSMSEFESD